MNFIDTEVAPLGMGCWPIGGEMYSDDGSSLGYTNSDDKESIRTIHAALANGITLFDTAAAYGAGHSERLLAKALKNRPESQLITKIGIAINEDNKQLSFDDIAPAAVIPAIDACLSRLKRERIDLLLLHCNDMSVEVAGPLFDQMEVALEAGKIKSFGWSTDFTDRVDAMAGRSRFMAVEHAMNVLADAADMQRTIEKHRLTALIRSPLAMGLLSGKYTQGSAIPPNDVRAGQQGWLDYYIDGRPNPAFLQRYEAVTELLQTGGRTPVQGALGWLWAKGKRNIPIPGARTVTQIEGLAAALEFGELPAVVMAEIETLIVRDSGIDGEQRAR
ncbi:aldo/keto reductase [Chromatiales bacterium (ex Bugula neritina AB1)]|nr:aldo/keto reductase [Chromatiales bacterium (ex Bugula neritina AB1)]